MKKNKSKKLRKIHGNPISFLTMSYFWSNPVLAGWGLVRSSKIWTNAWYTCYHPLLKTPMPWYSFMVYSFIHFIHFWTIVNFVANHIYFFLFPIFISNSTLVVLFVEKCQQLMDNVSFSDTYALDTHTRTIFAHILTLHQTNVLNHWMGMMFSMPNHPLKTQ